MSVRRLRQGVLALVAWARPVDDAPAAGILTPPLLALFRQMPRREQQHALEVLATLRSRGATHPALLTAGLLHDVGKLRAPLPVWQRVLVVLLEKAMPAQVHTWGDGDPHSWRRPFVTRRHHAQWSAEMVATAGADALTLALIRRHQDTLTPAPSSEEERLLAALQAADDAN
jgi:HD domain